MNDVSILVVDDDDDVRGALLDELSPQYVVTSAACGEEAFVLLAERQFDVVISDLRMPDHDGLEVLDFAHKHQRDAVRILLTGYVDDRAHAALLQADAPFKVGKPWHDEIDVLLRRTLEQRRRKQAMAAALAAAVSLDAIDAELASAGSLSELGEILVLNAAVIPGMLQCGAIVESQVVAGAVPDGAACAWTQTFPIDGGRQLFLAAGGADEESRELFEVLVHHARRRLGVQSSARTRNPAEPTDRSRIDELLRQATLGASLSSIMHDLAGILQGIEGTALHLTDLAARTDDLELLAAADEVAAAGAEVTEYFLAARQLLREGQATTRDVRIGHVVDRALRQVGGAVRARAHLEVSGDRDVSIRAAEPLAAQALVAILRNAAEASPPALQGRVDVRIRTDRAVAIVEVVDDGGGVPAEVAAVMFEPHAWRRGTNTGAGLAIAAYAMRAQGGTISYRREPGRGACFSITLPRADTAAESPPDGRPGSPL